MKLHFRYLALGICATFTTITARADGLVLGGRSAGDAFHDTKVVLLIKEALDGDEDGVKDLVKSGVEINKMGDGGATPLLWTMLNQNLNAMKILLNAGANPNEFMTPQAGASGFSPPVLLASGSGQTEMLKLLLAHGGDPSLEFGNRTPLTDALTGSHLDCAELLAKAGANINWFKGSRNAFFATMLTGKFDQALWVLNHGYTHDLPMAKKLLEQEPTNPGEEDMKAQALAIVDHLLAQQDQKPQN